MRMSLVLSSPVPPRSVAWPSVVRPAFRRAMNVSFWPPPGMVWAPPVSTSEPNLLALASDVQARVAMATKDWTRAERHIESALAIVANFDIPTTGWRVHATRADLYRSVKDETAAEQQRARAEAVVV